MPLLSVIVPIYNTAPYLSACLQSIVAGEGKEEVEVLLVSDGSTDESEAIARQYVSKYPRLFQLIAKEHGGLSSARNAGLDRATGDYLAFLDSDDVWEKDFLPRVLAACRTGADLILLTHREWQNDALFTPRYVSSPDPVKNALLAPPMVWLRVFSRSLLGDLRFAEGLWYEDLPFSVALALKAESVLFLEEPLYRYRKREGSISANSLDEKTLDIFPVMALALSEAKKSGKFPLFEKEMEWLFIQHLFRSAALRAVKRKDAPLLLKRIRSTVEENFPCWRRNPYLKKSSLPLRLAVLLASGGQSRLLSLFVWGKERFL